MAPLPSSVAERLDRLAPDQRDAATAPPGPVLCVAPAGSGKTTTLVARVAWLVGAAGADPATIAAITFNTRAAEELRARLDPALAPLSVPPGAVRVRTFHALGLEILRDTGELPQLRARDAVLRRARPDLDVAARRRLDGAFSRLKLNLAVTAEDVARDPAPGPVARAFLAYEEALAEAGAIDFDDLVALALRRLEADPLFLNRWRSRCAHLLVDEVQDVDASQLRLALLLAAPANRIFLVGDDDQSIYGWRLADVRRVLGLAAALPGLRRVDLEVNYRCPAPVVAAAVRLVEHNAERFAKQVRPRPDAPGRLVLAPAPTQRDPTAEMRVAARALDDWPADGGSRAILARTRRELLPAAALSLERGIPFRADGVTLLLEDPRLDGILAEAAETPAARPLLLRLGEAAAAAIRTASSPDDASTNPDPDSARPPTDRGDLDEPAPEAPRRAARGAPRLGRGIPGARGAAGRHRRRARASCRPPRCRPAPDPRHGPRDEGARVRPRRRDRHVRGAISEPALPRRCDGPGASPGGGAPPRLRRVDARAPHADARLRALVAVALPRRGVRARRDRRRGAMNQRRRRRPAPPPADCDVRFARPD
jgi:hypothetical protein